MIEPAPRWTLADLVEFEHAATRSTAADAATRQAVAEAIRGCDGAAARRHGFRAWLARQSTDRTGNKVTSALGLTSFVFSAALFLTGISAVLGLMDHARGGMNVTLFLAILIGGQWLVLIAAALAWLARHRAAEGFSGVQAMAGRVARKFAGAGEGWWRGLMDGGGAPRAAMLWRLARIVQTAGVWFNLGILTGLGGLVMLRHVGFFWETTTDSAMHDLLEKLVRALSLPWAAWWPTAVPSGSTIDASRWLPDHSIGLAPGPAAWWEFLLACVACYGLLPRAILAGIAWQAERRALNQLDFQGRHHRALWREIAGLQRTDTDEKPLDGVLVLDVGGSGISQEALRPFLLQRLHVHPATWATTAVLDAEDEAAAARALTAAPAGVVLFAEGWSLSPARMKDLHARARKAAGNDKPVIFLVANTSDSHPVPATLAEREIWTRFVDSLRDPNAEIAFFE